MYRLMRNIHLGLGLGFAVMALIFAISSVVFIYQPKRQPVISDSVVKVPSESAANPRLLARTLMTGHNLRGDLRQIQEKDGQIKFRIVRPGEAVDVVYEAASGEAKIKTTRQGFLSTLQALHTNHGL